MCGRDIPRLADLKCICYSSIIAQRIKHKIDCSAVFRQAFVEFRLELTFTRCIFETFLAKYTAIEHKYPIGVSV